MKKRIYLTIVLFLTLFAFSCVWATPTIEYQIKGLNDTLKKNTLAWLDIEEKQIGEPLTLEKINLLHEKGANNIKAALAPYGYFYPTITSKLEKTGKDTWVSQFTVILGPALNIRHVSLSIVGEGANLPVFKTFMQNFPLKSKQIFNTETYNEQKKKLNNIATNAGFMDGHFTVNKVAIDRQAYQTDIILIYDTGPQYYFGPVHFSENPMDKAFLTRYVQFKQGNPYSPAALLSLQQNLSNAKYFQSVAVEPGEKNANHEIPIEILLIPSKSQQYNFGVGYGTDTGIRGTIGWDLNHITESGQSFTSFFQASHILTTLEAKYHIPGKNPVSEEYFIGASVSQESPNTSEGHTQKVTIGKTDQWRGWQSTLSLSEQFDQYELRHGPREHTNLLLPSWALLRVNTDNPAFTRNGTSYAINIRGASQSLLSSSNFLQAEFVPRLVYSPNESNRFILRADLGWTATNNIEKVPLSLQYFAGGSDSIRGYSYEELGPGKYLLVGSTEYQHEVYPNWFAAVFVDAGNALNSFDNPQKAAIGHQSNINLKAILKFSTGIGVVWVSPVGPMELTIGKPLASDSDMHPRVQFTMGTNL